MDDGSLVTIGPALTQLGMTLVLLLVIAPIAAYLLVWSVKGDDAK